ncbi:MAG: Ldh family oxidoreductase [Candidatus Aenigmarchaeota archaeon]|nr:Ldh family oxidoreductase [Candidatus Aenigmarchaeota archaeon]
MQVAIQDLRALCLKALKHQGYTNQESATILDILLYAQLRGNNQGVVKLIGKGIPKRPDAGTITVIKETAVSALLDGGKNFGMIVSKKATDIAITKAKNQGLSIVGTRNAYLSTGAIGYYAREIAQAGYIGFVFAGSQPTVAPHGSSQALFGTNPLAIGLPTRPEPVVLDMATAAMAYYGLIEAKTAGKPIPGDIAYDAAGAPTRDPAKAMEGAIKGFGGHKGSGLGFMVTALTGPLVGAMFGDRTAQGNGGSLLLAIDPNLLADPRTFQKDMVTLVAKMKEAKKLPGVSEVYIPGERGNQLTNKHLAAGKIEIEDRLYQELAQAAKGPGPRK